MSDKNKPHVCFVSTNLYGYLKPEEKIPAGGAQRQQYKIAKCFVENGYQVSVITGEYDSIYREQIEGITIIKALPPESNTLTAPIKAMKLFSAMYRIAPDVFYTRGSPFLCILVAIYCNIRGVPFIYAISNDNHISIDEQNLYDKVYLRAIASADKIIAQTKHQENILRNKINVDPTVVTNMYEIPPDETVVPGDSRKFILWVGKLDEQQKKPHRILEVAQELPDVGFVLAGPPGTDESYNQSIKKTSETLDNVTFKGFVSPDNIHELFKNAIALVNTSDYEGFPNTYLEAWRMGTPVIALHHSPDGVIEHQKLGRRSGSMKNLKKDIRTISKQKIIFNCVSDNCRKYVKNNHSVQVVFDRYLEILDSALAQ